MYGNCLYNVAAALCDGRIIGLIPKKIFPLIRNFMKQDISPRVLTNVSI